MRDETWIIVDTETSGLAPPIFVVEIAAQRMRGWQRDGEPFRVLLNHDVRIEPMAQALHGYSREYLREHGGEPHEAHRKFHEFASELPVVAYNISYDWDRALVPEYGRLGVPATGRKGFCAMTLARRTISESLNYKLETLREHFHVNADNPHRGDVDVQTLCVLCEQVFAPRLNKAGIVGFDAVAQFSRQTPVARCLQQVMGTAATPSAQPKRTRTAGTAPAKIEEQIYTAQYGRWGDELAGLCRGILADGVVNERELVALHEWLATCPCTHVHPINTISEKVEQIVCDGVITAEELEQMGICLESLSPATG